jgi:hypothetical protein
MVNTNEVQEMNGKHLKLGKIPNFATLYAQLKSEAVYEFKNEHQREPEEEEIKLPKMEFFGSEKIHGTNMAVCFDGDEWWIQGRNRCVSIEKDQDGMCLQNTKNIDYWKELKSMLVIKYGIDTTKNLICFDAEWAGGNIQRGNSAVSNVPKAAYLFDMARIRNKETGEVVHLSTQNLSMPSQGIYNLYDFNPYYIVIDFNNPEAAEIELERLVKEIEENSPVARYFDKRENVGEGIVFTSWDNDRITKFKIKGLKHGGKPKVKTPKVQRSSEEQQRLYELADEITPIWRIDQGIDAVNAQSITDMGKVIKWVTQDILAEEQPLITTSEFEWKDLHRAVVAKIKKHALKWFEFR